MLDPYPFVPRFAFAPVEKDQMAFGGATAVHVLGGLFQARGQGRLQSVPGVDEFEFQDNPLIPPLPVINGPPPARG